MAKVERFLAWFFYSVALAFVAFAILIVPGDLFAAYNSECKACLMWPAGSKGRADCASSCCKQYCTDDTCKSKCCEDACGTDNACVIACHAANPYDCSSTTCYDDVNLKCKDPPCAGYPCLGSKSKEPPGTTQCQSNSQEPYCVCP